MAEPWFRVAEAVALPPLKLWFRWRFEHLERIPRRGPALIACNHISYLDPLSNAYAVVRAGRHPRFLAKNDLFRIPVVGRALRGCRQIPVSRGTGGRRPLELAERALAAGEVVVIYPEGTVTRRPDSLPMEGKTGAVRLSLASGVSITPLVSWGSQAVWQKSGRGSLKPGRPVWVSVGEPFDARSLVDSADDRNGVAEATAALMERLRTDVIELRERYPAEWAPRTG